ncbi:oxidized low-density lipoprotein receptor 1-like isoform X2 [Penaeus japonicus]|uniref:oxidized low-density lipoprotein receptor 1-like isoform X2 n=1 Tax=Penaeus japonicus TaxID=27405 RepID=UPI001C70EE56|nr:oxidized low-density lipoprotein receptor 1-like isoform X2 [Penaeus japonicus]
MRFFLAAAAVIIAASCALLPVGAEPSCEGEGGLSEVLREIKDAISAGNRRCRDSARGGMFGEHTEQMLQALRQHGEVVESLQTHTDSLNKALGAVAEVQASQKFLVASLQAEMESERIARTQQRRVIEDLQTDLNRLKEESKVWVDHLNTMETDIKHEIKKTEEIAEGMATEVRSTGERVASLGKVIRRVQSSLQALERIVNRHTKTLVNIRKNKGQVEQEETAEVTVRPVQILPENFDCPHPYTKMGTGCFTVHSEVRKTWEEAREDCRNIDGDLANPFDLYDLALFLDETFSGRWGFWIGAELDDSDAWNWISGVPVQMQVDFWGRGEPGDALENEERCMFLHSLWRFRAGADSCSHKKFFVCERKLT